MTDNKKPTKAKNKGKKNTPHDGLIKKVMENPVAAAEFLDDYLPTEFKAMVDLTTIQVEKESFVEKNLTKQLSDIVLSVQTREGDKAFVYTLIEAQVTPDYLMALRLWKYILLLCERHTKDAGKFPLVCPLVLYHGSRKYDAPRNLWQLFTDPVMAKELLAGDYHLIDLQAMSDDDINYDKHISMILYMMKYIEQRDDPLKLAADIFKHCLKAILIDRKQGYLYIKLMIWYIDSRVPIERKQELEQLIKDNLQKDSEDVMRTIAQAYRDEGRDEGREEGEARGIEKTAINMLRENADIKFVAGVTGLSLDEVLKLKHKI